MKFDVIIGNPPYQMNDGGAAASAMPLYQKFVQQAKKVSPKFITMIMPSRWFAGGKGLDEFRNEMLEDKRIRSLVDYPVSSECFPGVEIKGGVCYFIWDRDSNDECVVRTVRGKKISTLKRPLLENNCDIFVRYNEAITIMRKVLHFNENSFADIVSSRKPFGLTTDFKDFSTKVIPNGIIIYANKTTGYVRENQIIQNHHWVDEYKIYITRAYGAGEDFPHQILNKPIFGDKGTCCTETYLLIGPFDSKERTMNAITYINTRFFRFMVLLMKNTQDAPKRVYQFVPMQNFDESWTDEKLYKKYGLNKEEINFIESMVRPME